MKFAPYLIACALLLFGCTTPDPMEEIITASIIGNMNDPSSFDLHSIKPIDTCTYRSNIHFRVNEAEKELSLEKEFPNDSVTVARLQEKLLAYKEAEQNLADKADEVICYNYEVVFYGANAIGAKVKNTWVVQVSPSGKVINATGDPKKVMVTPDHFPGYEAIVKASLR